MNLRRLLSLTASFGALSFVTACAAPSSVDGDDVGVSAESLTERDWGRAISYLGALDYLPWGYTDDGCYARAIYYTMNLAAEGIAANHVYIIAKDSAHGLGSTGRWTYHVAPLVSRDTTGQLFVLDPVYSRSPLPVADWYNRQSNWENTPNAPILKVAPGTTYGDRSGTVVPNPQAASFAAFREPAFSAMPAFSMSSVNAACAVMHRYIDAEPTTDAAVKARKHHDLSRDTRRLVTALTDARKLDGGALDASCTAYAPELASCPADSRANNPGSRDCCLASAFWCQSANGCLAPNTPLGDGRVCGAGGNFSHPVGASSGGASSGSTPPATCPADSPTTNPGTEACCLASAHWCWSSSARVCAAPGTRRTVSGVDWTCGPGGNWSR